MEDTDDIRFEYGSATALLRHIEANGYVLSNVYSRERGLGHGSALMDQICEYADRNELVIFLTVQQFGKPHDALNNQELLKFYRKYDFVPVEGTKPVRMIRYSMEE